MRTSNKVILVATALMFSQFATADCRDSYKDKIKQLDGRMNPPLGMMTANSIAAAAVPSVVVAAGGAVTLAGSLALPAVSVGAGTYYAILALKKNSFQRSLKLINDSSKGNGAQLGKFLHKIENQKSGVDRNEVISILVKANSENVFCAENEYNGKIRPFTYRQIKRYVLSALAAGDQAKSVR